jgi:hypothetical protein
MVEELRPGKYTARMKKARKVKKESAPSSEENVKEPAASADRTEESSKPTPDGQVESDAPETKAAAGDDTSSADDTENKEQEKP